MTLRTQEIVRYLISRKLTTLHEVVSGDLIIIDASRRNRNLKVIRQFGRSYFVKLALEPGADKSVAREAALYRFFGTVAAGKKLQTYLPKFCCDYPQAHLLVLELRPEARNLTEHYSKARRCSQAIAAKMGMALASLHRLSDAGDTNTFVRRQFPGARPWIFTLCEPFTVGLSRASAANMKLIRVVQQFTGFREPIERLGREWSNDRLIHFDIRADNWLVAGSSTSGRLTRLNLVDWELAGMGDACWDIGSVFADYLIRWLLSIPMINGPTERFLELAGFPLTKIQRALRIFWETYVSRMSLGTDADRWLLRSVEYAGIRLLQRSYEQMQMSVDLTSNVICTLQVSQHMLLRPGEAAAQLLALPVGLTR
jgi:hypothetical protein